jgi:hypothetical protein
MVLKLSKSPSSISEASNVASSWLLLTPWTLCGKQYRTSGVSEGILFSASSLLCEKETILMPF